MYGHERITTATTTLIHLVRQIGNRFWRNDLYSLVAAHISCHRIEYGHAWLLER